MVLRELCGESYEDMLLGLVSIWLISYFVTSLQLIGRRSLSLKYTGQFMHVSHMSGGTVHFLNLFSHFVCVL